MSGHTLRGFIDDVLLPELRAMVRHGAGYLAYGQIAIGIEFLGACRDSHDFAEQGHSKCRFERGITDYMGKIDARYAAYNNSASPYYLYKHLRCGMAHLIRPQGKVGLIGKGNADAAGLKHLEKHPKYDAIVLVLEPFLEDFDKACQILKADIPTLTHPKISLDFLPVSPA